MFRVVRPTVGALITFLHGHSLAEALCPRNSSATGASLWKLHDARVGLVLHLSVDQLDLLPSKYSDLSQRVTVGLEQRVADLEGDLWVGIPVGHDFDDFGQASGVLASTFGHDPSADEFFWMGVGVEQFKCCHDGG